MLLPNDVIAVGFRPGRDVHLICTQNGLAHIPPALSVSKIDSDGYADVRIAITEQNMVALRLCGVSANDVKGILASSTTTEEQ